MKSHFIERMMRQFGSRPCPKGLIEGWHQLEKALAAAQHQPRWQVIKWPTGTGKTEALAVLCATPTIAQHPAALVVTKFTREADKIAERINALAGTAIALAVHQKSTPVTTQVMTESPVLVITQEAYRVALREACDKPDTPIRLELYHRYHHSTRSWIVIDEAFNWIDAYEVDLDEALAMCGALSVHMDSDDDLCRLLAFLQQLRDDSNATQSDRLLPDRGFASLASINLDRLRNAVKNAPAETTELWRGAGLHLCAEETARPSAVIQRTSFKNAYTALLSRLDAIKRIGHCWVSQRSTRPRLHSSRLLLDTDRPCGLILDATASLDRTYDLLREKITILPRPKNMRSYKNVTVYVSRPHRVGKSYLASHATEQWQTLAPRVSGSISPTSKVLTITHKHTRTLLRDRLACAEQSIGHWGDLDGKNEWRHCDTVLIFGLPYPDDITPTDTFHACIGHWSSDWFTGMRKYEDHADVKLAIKYGFTARNVVQAINRARCRTMVDDEGNCASTEIFILLPRGAVGDAILAAIRTEMPDVRLVDWQALALPTNERTPNERRLLSMLQRAAPGAYTKAQILDRLGIVGRTFERMSAKLRKQSSAFARALTDLGVEYHCTIGRGNEAYFIKR